MVGDPVRDELHQPAVVKVIKEPTDVCVEHPIHALAQESDAESIQRLMLATTRSETI
jgi:hypothetical protein